MEKDFDIFSWFQAKPLEEGILEVYKPYGLPSNAVVELVKKALVLKVGHGGTLDPLAEGKLILGVGKGTKKLQNYLGGNKVYKAKLIYGLSSISGDLEQIAEVIPFDNLSEESVFTVIDELKSPYIQKVPIFSAVKVKGKRMYDLAREGKLDIPRKEISTQLLKVSDVEFKKLNAKELISHLNRLKEAINIVQKNLVAASESLDLTLYRKYDRLFEEWKEMFVNTLANVSHSTNDLYIELTLTVEVPKGTYIRALVDDIGERLGVKGTLLYLERKTTVKE